MLIFTTLRGNVSPTCLQNWELQAHLFMHDGNAKKKTRVMFYNMPWKYISIFLSWIEFCVKRRHITVNTAYSTTSWCILVLTVTYCISSWIQCVSLARLGWCLTESLYSWFAFIWAWGWQHVKLHHRNRQDYSFRAYLEPMGISTVTKMGSQMESLG